MREKSLMVTNSEQTRNAQARIVVQGMTTGYKGFSVSNISFELRGGDIFGLLGRSGSRISSARSRSR